MRTIFLTIPVAAAGSTTDNRRYESSSMTDTPTEPQSPEAAALSQAIPHFPDEAVYVYCFRRKRLLYAAGFLNLLGFEDSEISMLRIIRQTTPQFAAFAFRITDKALQFVQAGHPDIEQYSFTMELNKYHKQGHEVPVITRIGVFEMVNGQVASVIGRIQMAPYLHFGNVMRYAAYGPDENLFEEELSKALFQQPVISAKEREALALVAAGAAFKEIAGQLGISHSAVEKRILPLYKRFAVKSLAHLVSYAYDNGILP